MSEIKCYALELVSSNLEDMQSEMDYITTSFKCNNGFIGVHIDRSKPMWRHLALFTTPKARNDCYNRIINRYGKDKPRVAIVIPICYVDTKYLKN